MDYVTLKLVHQGAVGLSIFGFLLRCTALLSGASWVRGKPARTLPHVLDTVLLASALGLAWTLGLNPATTPWLLAKIIGLVVYVALGMVALKPGWSRRTRGIACLAALACYLQIAATAITKDPAGLLALL
ncbi:MAG: hypothetical protein AMXMBFR6_20150 [Betaproteobacteria bacterium]